MSSKSPGKGDESDERYNSARDYFNSWQEEGILIRDDAPAFYLYLIDYKLPSGLRYTRKGFIGLIELSDFSEGIVRPHEQTFDTVTADRLRLMDTCQAQFSQIFSLYSDPEMQIIAALEERFMLDSTVVLFVSDHGELLGHHGLLLKSIFQSIFQADSISIKLFY